MTFLWVEKKKILTGENKTEILSENHTAEERNFKRFLMIWKNIMMLKRKMKEKIKKFGKKSLIK
jgi:hypothetical protein